MFKLITFDLDHTLWTPDAALERATSAMHQWLINTYPQAAHYSLRDMLLVQREIAKNQPELSFRVSTIRVEMLRQILLQLDIPAQEATLAAQQGFQVFYQERSKIEFYPHALTTLAQLNKNYPLIALTNGNADLNLIGIAHLFKIYLNAEIAGAPKPHFGMFNMALQFAKVAAPQAVHVGDSPEMDMLPAKQLGMKTVWANYSAMTWPEDLPKPDQTITAIEQLPAALAALEAGI